MSLYDELNPDDISKNPAEKEIKQILKRYRDVTSDLDREAARLRQVTSKKEVLSPC